jgi:transcriptional regulator with XRE-family HTH domain
MKQSELCAKTKIPKSAMSQYISGAFEPKQDRIYLIARALSVSEAWLMGYDVPMERQDPKKNPSPDKVELNDGEKLLLDLFRKIPEDKQGLVLQMIRVALGKQE